MALSLRSLLFVTLLFSSFLLCSSQYTHYEEDVAKDMMPFASVPYCDVNDIVDWNLTDNCSSISNFQLVTVFNDQNKDSVAILGYDTAEEIIVVAFKGTDPDDLADWIDDLQGDGYYGNTCNLTPTLAYQGHLGFCDYYLSLRNLGLMDEFVKLQAQYPNFRVFSIGHSLGGAAAAIFALDALYTMGGTPLKTFQLITFGQPRVGDPSFVRLMAPYSPEQVWRIIHNQDIVPHLGPCCPAAIPFNGSCAYQATCAYHVSTEIWYPQEPMVGSGSKYDVCSMSQGEDPTCSDSGWNLSIPDHLNYFDKDIAGQCCVTNSAASSPSSKLGEASRRKLKIRRQDVGGINSNRLSL